MRTPVRTTMSRRYALQLTAACAALGAARSRAAESDVDAASPITKPIPATGEKLPVVGLGTNAFGVTAPQELAQRREVLRRLPELGGSVVDTAPAYGSSEAVLGNLIADLGNRDQLFLATKVTAADGDAAAAERMIEESLRRLRVERIDLMQVHNLTGVDVLMPLLEKWKQSGRIRYIGITTSNPAAHAQTAALLRKYVLDFVQIDYSIDNRGAEQEVFPLARDRGTAVLVNMPLGGRRAGNLLAQIGDRPLPDWAAEIGAQSWAQLLLKYCVSHPAVTCAIPGTTKPHHLEDNQAAGRGALLDAAMRTRFEKLWDSTSA